ncbi:hypothetical protein ACXX82_02435 [Glaciimonas sp. GNP009]
MNTNQYEKSIISETPLEVPSSFNGKAEMQTPFFAVSITKLLVLSFCTFGLYQIVWLYRNWQLVKAREKINIVPFARALFAFLFCYQMFKKIRDFKTPNTSQGKLHAGSLTIAWIVVASISRLGHICLLISLMAPIFFVPVQIRVNQINHAVTPDHDKNDRFSVLNWLTIVIGGVLFMAVIIGSLVLMK